jgi:NAD-dependent dihydropyrimidine dehydrogenase PreA subunit
MSTPELYHRLAEEIGAKGSRLIPMIFERLCDLTEARILLAAAPAKSPAQLAEELDMTAEETEARLLSLFQRGLVFKTKGTEGPRYYRVRSVIQLHDSTTVPKGVPRDYLDLWKEHTEKELPDFWRSAKKAFGRPVARIIPIGHTIEPKSQILAYEDVRSIVEGCRSIAVTNCACRAIDGKCGKPLEVCLQLNRAADYAVERGTGRALTKDEAMDIIKLAERAGLVHIVANQGSGYHTICNCCRDCCVTWATAEIKKIQVAAPSRFLAQIDPGTCTGCGVCIDTCPFDAISWADGGEDLCVVYKDKCMGCGVCAELCPSEAIILREVRKPDFIPVEHTAAP